MLKLIRYILRHSRQVWLAGIILLISILLARTPSYIQPVILGNIVDLMGSGVENFSEISIQARYYLYAMICAFFGWKISEYCIVKYELSVLNSVLKECYQYVIRHSQTYINSNFVGSIVSKVTRMSGTIEGLMDTFIFQISNFFIGVTIMSVVLWRENMWLGIGAILWMLILFFIKKFLWNWVGKYKEASAAHESKMYGKISDSISNHFNVHAFGAINREIREVFQMINVFKKKEESSWFRQNVIYIISAILITILELGAILGGLYLWKNGEISTGTFVVLFSYLGMYIQQLITLNQLMRSITHNVANAVEMIDILETPHDIVDASDATTMSVPTGRIELKHVDFTYPEYKDQAVYRDFSLTIEPGEKIGLVGKSGSGKSTLIKLLQRFYDIDNGSIQIDGVDISSVTQDSLRTYLGIVPQESILFHRTIGENISYAHPDATKEQIIEAAKRAHAHEFIEKLEDGYDTLVGERGVKLSGGQRQRVAIARVILEDAPILILDEATSALDSKSEKLIQDSLDIVMEGKTTLAIAHRLSTIMKMDRILVLEDGAIIEQGTHDELIARKNGHYEQLWKLQAGELVDDIS